MRELLPWEKTVVSKLGATDPKEAQRILRYLTKETSIVGGCLVTTSTESSK